MPRSSSDRDRAFGAGCDARIAGLPCKPPPGPYRTLEELSRAWREGWWDAHQNWGARVRHDFAKLPPVEEAS